MEKSGKNIVFTFFRYTARIMEIDPSDVSVLIHFDGWNSRFDEWMSMTSERLRCITRHSDRKDLRSKANAKAVSCL